MSSASVILHSAFDPALLRFGPLDTKSKKKSAPVEYGGNRRILVQTPAVGLPFGVSAYEELGVVQSYSIDFAFRGYETNPAMAAFLDKMRAAENMLLEAGVKNSENWMGKKMPKELVAEFAKRFTRDSTNPQYPPNMRVKVPMVDGKVTTEFFDENRQPVTMDAFVKGSTAVLIMEMSSVWFMGGKSFGVTWRARQARLVSKPGRLDGYSFLEDGEVEEPAAGDDAPVEMIEDPDA